MTNPFSVRFAYPGCQDQTTPPPHSTPEEVFFLARHYYRVSEFHFESNISQPYTFKVYLTPLPDRSDRGRTNPSSFFAELMYKTVGVEAEVDSNSHLARNFQGPNYIYGVVTRIRIMYLDDIHSSGLHGEYRNFVVELTINSVFSLLDSVKDHHVYHDKTTKEIITQVFSRYKQSQGELLNILFLGADIFVKRVQTVQMGESDSTFVHRLLQEEGLLYYFVHTKEGVTLVFARDILSASDDIAKKFDLSAEPLKYFRSMASSTPVAIAGEDRMPLLNCVEELGLPSSAVPVETSLVATTYRKFDSAPLTVATAKGDARSKGKTKPDSDKDPATLDFLAQCMPAVPTLSTGQTLASMAHMCFDNFSFSGDAEASSFLERSQNSVNNDLLTQTHFHSGAAYVWGFPDLFRPMALDDKKQIYYPVTLVLVYKDMGEDLHAVDPVAGTPLSLKASIRFVQPLSGDKLTTLLPRHQTLLERSVPHFVATVVSFPPDLKDKKDFDPTNMVPIKPWFLRIPKTEETVADYVFARLTTPWAGSGDQAIREGFLAMPKAGTEVIVVQTGVDTFAILGAHYNSFNLAPIASLEKLDRAALETRTLTTQYARVSFTPEYDGDSLKNALLSASCEMNVKVEAEHVELKGGKDLTATTGEDDATCALVMNDSVVQVDAFKGKVTQELSKNGKFTQKSAGDFVLESDGNVDVKATQIKGLGTAGIQMNKLAIDP